MRIALAVLVVLGFASNARAVAHDGLYIRGQLGVGGAAAGSEVALTGTDITFRGAAGWLNLEVGGAVQPGLIIFGKLYGMSVPDPTLQVGAFEFDTDISGYFGGLGAGLTYYFMPSNFYLTGAMTLSRLGSKEGTGNAYDSGIGLMVHGGFGCEFLVAPDFGVGVGIEGAFGGFPDEDIDEDGFVWGGGYGVLAFTATYN